MSSKHPFEQSEEYIEVKQHKHRLAQQRKRFIWLILIVTCLLMIMPVIYSVYTASTALQAANEQLKSHQQEAATAVIQKQETEIALAATENANSGQSPIAPSETALVQTLLSQSLEKAFTDPAKISPVSNTLLLIRLQKLNVKENRDAILTEALQGTHLSLNWEQFTAIVCAQAGENLSQNDWDEFFPD